jgi:hypothetical protein
MLQTPRFNQPISHPASRAMLICVGLQLLTQSQTLASGVVPVLSSHTNASLLTCSLQPHGPFEFVLSKFQVTYILSLDKFFEA